MPRLTPPTRRGFVRSAWGADRSYRGGWHEGLDFPGERGEPVLAAAAGKVVRVDNVDNSYAGRWVGIDHGDGVVSRYLHNDRNDVSLGQVVSRGQQIGLLGSSGTQSGYNHVHFDIKGTKAAIDDYVRRFGMPSTGMGRTMSYGIGMPSEPFMSGATFDPKALAQMAKAGVPKYAPPWLTYIAVGGGLYLLYRHLQRR